MTLSAPKPAYQLQDVEPSEIEPFAPEEAAAGFANDPEAHPDQWHELPSHVEKGSDEPEQQRIEDLHASFHDQLAVLVRALDSDDEHRLEAGEGTEAELVYEDDEGLELTGGADDEPWNGTPGRVLLASLENMLIGRTRGFVLGLGASIALGGIALILASGRGEPPIIASSDPQNEPHVAFEPAANKAAGLPLRASLMDEIEPGRKLVVESVKRSGTNDTRAGEDEPAADPAAAVPGMVIEPAEAPRSVAQDTNSAQQASHLADAFASATEPERSHDLRDEAAAEMVTGFETTVETAFDSQSASDDVDSSSQILASARETGPTAHVVKHVNMRAGPDNAAAILAIVPEGAPVKVVQCDQWCEVISEGQRGWIYKDLLSGAIGG